MNRRAAKHPPGAGASPTRGASDHGALPAFSLPGPARALFVALAVTAALRALAPFVPGRALWGLDLARDLAPAAFWPAWLALAAALAWPALSGRVVAALPAPRWPAAVALAVMLAALAWAFPERAFVTGDTSLRHGAFTSAEHPEQLVPQALPADLLLHHALPRALAARTPLSPEAAGRAWGAALALAWTFAAWALAHAAGTSAAARWAAFAAAAFGAQLALHNGYAKAIVEMNVCVLALAAALVALARERRGLPAAGLATAFALLLHRSAFALLPAWLAALALAASAPRDRRAAPWEWLLAAAPLGALVLVGPRAWRTLTTFDTAKHATPAASALSATALGDAAQALALTAPLALVALALFARAAWWRRREAWALAALALPQLALLVLVRPQQGLWRDWDVFVSAGIAVSALAAWLAAEALDESPRAAWLALPALLAAAPPAVQWLAHQSDAPRALARAGAILAGPPARPADERANGFDHLGMMWLAAGDDARAEEAFGRSVEAAPNPRVIVQWGMSAALRGDAALARDRYLRAVEANPALLVGWKGVAAAASALGDVPTMERAAAALEQLAPADPTTGEVRAWLQANRPAVR